MEDTRKEVFDKILLGLFGLLLLATPMIFSNNTNELYEFPKTFFIYFVGITICLIFAIKLVVFPARVVMPNKRFLFLLLSFGVATLFSSHLYTSLWGYYTRFNGGLVSVAIFFALFVVAINTFDAKHFNALLLLPLLGAFPINVYAIFQYFFMGEQRVYSTLGQPNWLAAYMVMLLPLILHKLFNAKNLRLVWFLVGIFCYSGIWLTFSMSGFLGMLGAFVFYLILNFELIRRHKLLFVFFVMFCLVFSIATATFFMERVSDVLLDAKKFVVGWTTVYAQDSYLVSDPGFIRKGMWQGALKLIFSSPKVFLVGTGPETFPYAFQPFRPALLNYSSEWDFILNKPHNYYLELFSQNGVLGFIAYLTVLLRSLRLKHKFITPALFGFYVTNFFGWPTATTTLLFWFFLSFLTHYEKN